jgi:hypothetical protein
MMMPKRNEELNFDKTIGIPNNLADESAKVSGGTEVVNTSKSKASDPKQTEGEEDLQGTVFISNLPFDIDNEEVKQRFSGFGEVQSFIPVLHRITKYAVLLTWHTSVLMPCCSCVLISSCLLQAPKRNWFSQVQNGRCSYCCSYSCERRIWLGDFSKR